MSKQFATVAVMAALSLALVGCGSDGPNLRPELEKLTEQVEKQTKQLEQVQDDFDTERDTQEELLEEQLEKAREETEEAEREAEAERQRREAADRRAQQAQEQAQQEAQKREAGQRARGLLTALEAVLADNGITWAMPDNMASAEINGRNTDIELTASPLKGSTRKSGDFYTATLTRTAPGVNQPERKTVAYTDREKSRTFANHYASFINSGVGGTTSNPRFVNAAWVGNLRALSIVSNPSRGGHPSTIANAAENPDNRMVSSLSARVRGVSGSYGCYDTGSSEACDIVVAATYEMPSGAPTGAREELDTLTITPEPGGTLYFDPGSGTISLLNDVEKTGAPPLTDGQYMTFGWWQERPAMSDGAYKAAVFAAVTGGTYSSPSGSAEYEGPAVGLYVDRTSEGGATIYESGDFTATAILRATFDGTPSVKGDVTNFRTTHGAKNWHVRLNDDDSAEIVQSGTSSDGIWMHEFLARHGNVDPDDDQPIAVTGRFDASIPNVRHIVGAFGAHRTTGPVPQ